MAGGGQKPAFGLVGAIRGVACRIGCPSRLVCRLSGENELLLYPLSFCNVADGRGDELASFSSARRPGNAPSANPSGSGDLRRAVPC
jgi:hypothetical protein